MPRINTTPAADAPRPDVIVDFTCDRGLLFISLQNIGTRSAYHVTTAFAKPLLGLGGAKTISDMQLFRLVEFMPPGKAFSQLVDPLPALFKRRGPAKVSVTITYRDRDGTRFSERITHDLRIYKDLGFTRILPPGGTNDGHSR